MIWIELALSLIIGISISYLVHRWQLSQLRRVANREAQELIEEAQNELNNLIEAQKHHEEELLENAVSQFEPHKQASLKRIQTKTDDLDDLESENQSKIDKFNNKVVAAEKLVLQREPAYKQLEAKVKTAKEKLQHAQQQLQTSLEKRWGSSVQDLKLEIQKNAEEETTRKAQVVAQAYEQEAQISAEREAKRILSNVLHRFARPYCPERGIPHIELDNIAHLEKVVGPNDSLLQEVEKICGVDVVINREHFTLAVMGFDPVRRELGRQTLEALKKEKNINKETIERIHKRKKEDLFAKVVSDGTKVTRELNLKNFKKEVLSMIGALRYRYSFAQNQYFHVGEVGYLCGLLAAELGESVHDARRAGLLHDIGKAMDHSREGGHAVIGADFIEKHGESAPVVHAVRAHHYDEQPSTNIAYLTIAADALSGARPGARRSTVESYSQKMADLEKIGNIFPGVQDTFILSAGREMRVFVDSQKMDDQQALDLSKKIATKIEEEMSYPGSIKVTVVRKTQAVEYAR